MADLAENITASQTTIQLNAFFTTEQFPPNGGVVQIGSEEIHYGGATDIELINCTRGFNGTTAATHLQDAVVTLLSFDVTVTPITKITTTQRDNTPSPSSGMLIYNTTTDKLNFYNGSAWEVVTSA